VTKYIFITGGVVSGIGKGITAASLGLLLKQRGLRVAVQKLDPYMNVDPGTMSPYQHGEVFVTDDGAETDLDLGHYERFIDENLTHQSNLTAGRVYFGVLDKERSGGYLGGTVQIIPHVTEEIKSFVYAHAPTDVLIVEIGGTVGDIECQSFLEAIRQISLERGRDNCLFVHVTLVPFLRASGEHKSKPTQHSVKGLMSAGITPNIIVTRSDHPISEDIKDKIALFANLPPDCVIENTNADSLYEVPIMLHKNGLDERVCRLLDLQTPTPNLDDWQNMVGKIHTRDREVTIAMVGKYTQLHDAYLSVIESLNHAGFEVGASVNIRWIDSESVTSDSFKGIDGMIIPGGFGNRGIEGKIAAARYAREHDVPFLGICLGMQIAAMEFARNVCGLNSANSEEFDSHTPHPVIHIMDGQEGLVGSGGTMRLGAYPCKIKTNTVLESLYGKTDISERHRHRFEFNNAYRQMLEDKGLTICGTSPDNNLVEAIELTDKRFFVGVQYHPEFKSRPSKPHPLFLGLLKSILNRG